MPENRMNSKRFLDAFVQIEMYFKKELSNPPFGFTQMLHILSSKNPMVNYHLIDLLEFAQLRNALVHNRSSNLEAIAEPHDEIVEKIESIAKDLNNPKKISDLNLQTVFTTTAHENIQKLAEIQEKNNYSVVPVYEQGRYMGLVHAKLYQKAFTLKDEIKTVSDLLKYEDKNSRLLFLPYDTSLRELVQRYFDLHEKGKGLLAVIISENGYMNEKPLGLITQADLPKILEMLE